MNGIGNSIAGKAPSAASGRRRRALIVSGTLLVVGVAFGVMVWLTSDPVRRELVRSLLGSPAGLIVLFGLSALSTATLILPAPGLLLTALAGSAGDPVVVGIVAGLGQAAGELTGYAAGWTGQSLVPDNPASRRLSGWLGQRGMLVIFLLALVPNPLFDLAGIAAGALRMPVLRYLVAAASGKVIKNVVIAGGGSTFAGLLGIVISIGS